MDFFGSIKNWHRRLKDKRKRRLLISHSKKLVSQVQEALFKCPNKIPVFIVCYNNAIYVKNMVKQLKGFEVTPIVIDNASNDAGTLSMLQEFENNGNAIVARSERNFGHMVGFIEPVYILLPEIFAYTDPDLQLNENLPKDFINKLAALTAEYSVFKAGFALSLAGNGQIIDHKVIFRCTSPIYFYKEYSVIEWESKFWKNRLLQQQFEVYSAPIDTTFAVYNKTNYCGDFFSAVRVAGNYSAVHLPWFPDLDLFSESERVSFKKGNISSSWA